MPRKKNPNNVPEKQCDGKTKHKTILSVEYYLENKASNANQTYYECEICGFLHIGSSPDNKFKGKVSKKNRDKDAEAFNKKEIRRMKY